MASYEQVCQRWIDRVTGSTTLRALRSDRIFPSHDDSEIYSYGFHFTMAQVLRDSKGAVRLILVNGDRYSHSTTNHQNHVRSVVKGSGLPFVILPFTVLRAAGIDRDSVTVVDKTDDGMQWLLRSSKDAPEDYSVSQGYVRNVGQAADGRYWFERQEHVLGESVVRATVVTFSGGASHGRTAYFLSGFDTQERHLSYFFAELPRKVTSLAAAYEALKPQVVIDAEIDGREVKRQGDVFAIPMPSATKSALRRAGATFGHQVHVLGTNHAATEVAVLGGVTLARRTLWHRPEGRVPDHRRVPLGDTWHVLVKNTVPITAGR